MKPNTHRVHLKTLQFAKATCREMKQGDGVSPRRWAQPPVHRARSASKGNKFRERIRQCGAAAPPEASAGKPAPPIAKATCVA